MNDMATSHFYSPSNLLHFSHTSLLSLFLQLNSYFALPCSESRNYMISFLILWGLFKGIIISSQVPSLSFPLYRLKNYRILLDSIFPGWTKGNHNCPKPALLESYCIASNGKVQQISFIDIEPAYSMVLIVY